MTGVQTCALPICYKLEICKNEVPVTLFETVGIFDSSEISVNYSLNTIDYSDGVYELKINVVDRAFNTAGSQDRKSVV